MKETSYNPQIGFGAAQNLDQNRFDRTQEKLNDNQLKKQVKELVKLYRSQPKETLQR